MKRRRLLAVAGAALGGTAGCLRRLRVDEADGPPSLDTPTVELDAGEETTATVTAENIGSMQTPMTAVNVGESSKPRSPGPEVDVTEENLTPSPNRVAESAPPIWGWSPPRASITAEVPIRVPNDAMPGAYDSPIIVWGETAGRGESLRDQITVRVPE